MTVSRTVLGKSEQKPSKIRIRPFRTFPASVSVKFGVTIPTVEYGSARCDVMLTMPCYKEEIVDVYHEVRNLCDHLIEKEAARLSGEEMDDG